MGGLVEDEPDMKRARLVFVCTGNRARSPLAEALLRRRCAQCAIDISSRGTLPLGPVPPLPEAVIAGQALGVDIREHRARQILPGELADADLVVGFEPFHVSAAVVDGHARLRVAFTILELAGILETLGEPGGDIAPGRERLVEVVGRAAANRVGSPLTAPALDDPLGQPQAVVDASAREIDRLTTLLARSFGCHERS